MHIFHHHHNREVKREQHPQACYHCGREFIKSEGGMLRRLKRSHHCPACHSDFDDGMDSKKQQPSSNISRLSKVLPLFSSSRKRIKAAKQNATTDTTRNSSSFDETVHKQIHSSDPDTKDGVGKLEEHEMIMSDEKYSCMDKRSDSCPFAFTYETEEVESYQMSHDNEEEVESYQMGWLLYNVP